VGLERESERESKGEREGGGGGGEAQGGEEIRIIAGWDMGKVF